MIRRLMAGVSTAGAAAVNPILRGSRRLTTSVKLGDVQVHFDTERELAQA